MLLSNDRHDHPSSNLNLKPRRPTKRRRPTTFLNRRTNINRTINRVTNIRNQTTRRPYRDRHTKTYVRVSRVFQRSRFYHHLNSTLLLASNRLFLNNRNKLVNTRKTIQRNNPTIRLIRFTLLIRLIRITPSNKFTYIRHLTRLLRNNNTLPHRRVRGRTRSFFYRRQRRSPLFSLCS